MPVSFEKYFRRAGAVGLFCAINPIGSAFGELVPVVTVSRSTLNKRLKEGRELGLVTKWSVQDGLDKHTSWVLTERGMAIYEELHDRRTDRRYQEYRDARRAYTQRKEDFVQYVASDENRAELHDYATTVQGDDSSSD